MTETPGPSAPASAPAPAPAPAASGRDTLIWNAYAELGAYERHLNGMQQQYRLLASTWLLAMFGGIGLVLSEPDLPVAREWLVGVIGLAGAVGITQLWNLDLRVYHVLLRACIQEGCDMERKYDWLPGMRRRMVDRRDRSTEDQAFAQRVAWFYAAGVFAALFVVFAAAAVAQESGPGRASVTIAGLVVAAVWCRVLIDRSDRARP